VAVRAASVALARADSTRELALLGGRAAGVGSTLAQARHGFDSSVLERGEFALREYEFNLAPS
jgi:hypothetical protein